MARHGLFVLFWKGCFHLHAAQYQSCFSISSKNAAKSFLTFSAAADRSLVARSEAVAVFGNEATSEGSAVRVLGSSECAKMPVAVRYIELNSRFERTGLGSI